jgi:hypothetical protein
MRQRRKRVEEKTRKRGCMRILRIKYGRKRIGRKGGDKQEFGGQDNNNEQAEIEAKESKEEGNIRMRTNL